MSLNKILHFLICKNQLHGKFNMRFAGATLWNFINEKLKIEKKANFKNKLFSNFIKSYSQ